MAPIRGVACHQRVINKHGIGCRYQRTSATPSSTVAEMTRICIWVLARTETLSRERNDGTSRRWDTLRRKRSPAPREIELRAVLVPVGTRLRSVALTHRTRLEGRSAAYFVRHIVTKQHAEKGIGKIGARHPNRRAAGEGS